jgi:ERCC4-type nuclease
MHWYIKLFLLASLGGYWLYRKSNRDKSDETSQSSEAQKSKKNDQNLTVLQIIEQLTQIDGVTSGVAKNLIDRGIKTREALKELSEEELLSIKGIGPKRAEKIMNAG